MATVPVSGTNIRLLSGVPFSNDYKNTRWFDMLSEQTSYFLSKTVVHSITEANFQRIEGYNFIAVNKSIDELWGTNYVMFQNASYNSKWFYGFVTKLEYKQKNTTYVHFQIDVFQTWKFEMNFKPSFVIREHCKLWNTDGSPVINTVDEGLSYGTEYETVSVDNYIPYEPVYFLVMVTKSGMHYAGGTSYENKILPSVNGLPQPLNYYVHPIKLTGDTPNVVIGTNQVSISSATDVLQSLFTQTSAVNNVVSVYITEYFGRNVSYDSATDTMTFNAVEFELCSVSDDSALNMNTLHVISQLGYNSISKVFTDKYAGFNSVDESKLLMYPYTVTILDDFKGNRVEIKNEYINSPDLSISVKGSLGTSNKTSYHVNDYLLATDEYAHIMGLEKGVINNNAQDLPIITDMLSAYLQGNRNSLENQKNSIVWNGVMGGVSNAIGGVASGLAGNPIGVASAGTEMITGAGNTVLQLQGLEAKKQDISNIPPQLVKMGGNTAFDFGNGLKGVFVIKKQIKAEYRKKLSDFFKMFGYKVNEVKTPNFHTRQNWNYVQTASCNITGNFNNEDLRELKSVFDNGITLWHTDDVGNYSLGNGVI